jgi:hypothetical protein
MEPNTLPELSISTARVPPVPTSIPNSISSPHTVRYWRQISISDSIDNNF